MAVVFDKELTFKQRLSQYDKESLKVVADRLGLRKLSKLKKEELADLIAERFLDPEVLFYYAAILSDKEMDLIDKGSHNGPIEFSPEDYDWIDRLNEMDFVAVSRNLYLTPCDLAEALKKIRTPEFEDYRKRASWVWKCLKFAEQFYGVTPIENMLNLVNCKKKFRMTEQEFLEIFDHFPEGLLWTIRIEDIFLKSSYAHDMESLMRLRIIQGEKDFYIPSVAEIYEFYETDALISDWPYQKLLHFVMREFDFGYEDAEALMYELWEKNAYDKDAQGTMRWFLEQFEFEGVDQIRKTIDICIVTANETRMLMNRGHKPTEIPSGRNFESGHMPTRAGSYHSAEEPVKKVYPNDLCPCGSGKKYKKCCGRQVNTNKI